VPDYEGIAARLRAIEEELGDLAYEQLREQARDRDPDSEAGKAAKAEEKRLGQARRAVAKAISALSTRD
jgi:hypothetical protein